MAFSAAHSKLDSCSRAPISMLLVLSFWARQSRRTNDWILPQHAAAVRDYPPVQGEVRRCTIRLRVCLSASGCIVVRQDFATYKCSSDFVACNLHYTVWRIVHESPLQQHSPGVFARCCGACPCLSRLYPCTDWFCCHMSAV